MSASSWLPADSTSPAVILAHLEGGHVEGLRAGSTSAAGCLGCTPQLQVRAVRREQQAERPARARAPRASLRHRRLAPRRSAWLWLASWPVLRGDTHLAAKSGTGARCRAASGTRWLQGRRRDCRAIGMLRETLQASYVPSWHCSCCACSVCPGEHELISCWGRVGAPACLRQ